MGQKRAELAEKLRNWANDDNIKPSPDFRFRVMEELRHRPSPVLPGVQLYTFADLLYDTIPENDLKRSIEKVAYPTLQPISDKEILSSFFYKLIQELSWRRRCSLLQFTMGNQFGHQSYVLLLDDSRISEFDQIYHSQGINSPKDLAEWGPVFSSLETAEDFNSPQLQFLQDFRQWENNGGFPLGLYEHAMEVLRLIPVLSKQKIRREPK